MKAAYCKGHSEALSPQTTDQARDDKLALVRRSLEDGTYGIHSRSLQIARSENSGASHASATHILSCACENARRAAASGGGAGQNTILTASAAEILPLPPVITGKRV